MTLEQNILVHCVRQTYSILFGATPFEKDFAAAYERDDELEIARLTALLIIAIELNGGITRRMAARWLELFEPLCPSGQLTV